jgi:hypothetical protein
MPRSSEKLVRFGCRYAPGMAGHVYTGYGYFLAEYKYLYQVYFQKMFYKRLRCFLELIHNVTQMTPDDTSSKKCFQRSKKIQSRYTPSMAEELWDLQDMFKVMGLPRYMFRLWVTLGMSKKSWYFREVWYSRGRFAPSMAANRGKIDLNCNKLGVAALQVWPRI